MPRTDVGRAVIGVLLALNLALVTTLVVLGDAVPWAIRTTVALATGTDYGELPERVLGFEGREAVERGELEAARRAFQGSLAIDPTSEFRRDLAAVHLSLGDADAARREAEAHLERFPRDGLGHLLLASALEATDSSTAAIARVLERGQVRVLEEMKELGAPVIKSGRYERKNQSQLERLGLERQALEQRLTELRGPSPD